MAGADRDAHIALRDVPAYVCTSPGHPALWVHGDFGNEISEILLYDGEFPYAASGLFGPKCRRCKARLKGSKESVERIERTFAAGGFDGISAALTADAVRCTACSFVQFRDLRSSSDSLSEALLAAFVAARLEHK
jgi:hypothetical protein